MIIQDAFFLYFCSTNYFMKRIILSTLILVYFFSSFASIKSDSLLLNTLLIDTLIADSTSKIETAIDSTKIIGGAELERLTNNILFNNKTYFSNEEIDQFINLTKKDLPIIDDKEIEKKLLAIETTLNIRFTPDIGKQVRTYIYYNRSFIVKMLTKAAYYFPIYEVEFDKINIPLELKYVSVIESHLNPKAKSYMGATGLWQFMYATAKYKGMKITTLEDQRRDPFVSTQFAANYFKQLHTIYDDWLLAMSAYNAGPGNINKAIRYAGGVKNYWIARPFMPRETQQYVPKIIALMYAMYYAEDYMLYPRKPKESFYDVERVDIPERLTIQYLAEILSIDSTYLTELNPMLTKNIVPSRVDSYKLIIPRSSRYLYEENYKLLKDDPYLTAETKLLEEKAVSTSRIYGGTGKYQTYTIQTGDNLGYIAELYSCRISDLKRWNGMNSNFLRVGKKLRIYNDKKVNTGNATTLNNVPKAKVGFKKDEINESTCSCYAHEIVYGDNLWDIASKYKTSIEKIKSVNNIYRNWKLRLGTHLKIPKN